MGQKHKKIVADAAYWAREAKICPEVENFIKIADSGPLDAKTYQMMYDFFEKKKHSGHYKTIYKMPLTPAQTRFFKAWRTYKARYAAAQLPPAASGIKTSTEDDTMKNDAVRKYTVLPIYVSFLSNVQKAAISDNTLKSIATVHAFLMRNKKHLSAAEISRIQAAWQVWRIRVANSQYPEGPPSPTDPYVSKTVHSEHPIPVGPSQPPLQRSEPTVIEYDATQPKVFRQFYPYMAVAVGVYLLYLVVNKKI